MTRREYTDRVLSGLRRLTGPEREAVRAELDAHMEDHICDLLDLGYDEELAEERTMQRMGDPEEVSRELNKQYPLRWLLLKWAAMALTLLFALLMLPPAWKLAGQVTDNLWNRFYPIHQLDLRDISVVGHVNGGYVSIVADAVEVDLRQTDDGVTLRVYQAGLEDPAAEETTAWAAVCLYSENPFFRAPRVLGDLAAPEGWEVTASSFFTDRAVLMVHGPVTYGEDIRFTYQQYGHRFAFTVPLPWEVGP